MDIFYVSPTPPGTCFVDEPKFLEHGRKSGHLEWFGKFSACYWIFIPAPFIRQVRIFDVFVYMCINIDIDRVIYDTLRFRWILYICLEAYNVSIFVLKLNSVYDPCLYLNSIAVFRVLSIFNCVCRLKFSQDFHVGVLAMSLFLRVHSAKNGPLRLDNTPPLEISKKSLRLIQILESTAVLATERKHVITRCISFCQDHRHSLADHNAFFELLWTELFEDYPWLFYPCMNGSLR